MINGPTSVVIAARKILCSKLTTNYFDKSHYNFMSTEIMFNHTSLILSDSLPMSKDFIYKTNKFINNTRLGEFQ